MISPVFSSEAYTAILPEGSILHVIIAVREIPMARHAMLRFIFGFIFALFLDIKTDSIIIALRIFMIYIIMELRRKTRFLAGTSLFWQERHPTLRKISFKPSIRLFLYLYSDNASIFAWFCRGVFIFRKGIT